MKLYKFILIFISLLNIFLLMNCNKDNNITEPKINITEDEHLKIASKKIGPSGGTIDFGDGTFLSIPENALANEVEISISKIKNAPSFNQYGIETFRLEPSGINLNKSVTLQTNYEEYQDFGEDLISVITYNQSQGIWERLKIIEQDRSKNTIKIEIDHFSWFKTIFDRALDLVMEIPGEYLIKSDVLITLVGHDWIPGHSGLYLGTKDENSIDNDGSTTIESSPWVDKPDGVQFSTLEDFINPSYSTHLYMGARRYVGVINNGDRTKIAKFAIGKINDGYYNVGDWFGTKLLPGFGQYNYPNEKSCYCSGLVEGSYDDADLGIVEDYLEWPGIMPLEQYVRTVPVDEIIIKSNIQLNVPVKGVVWDKTENEYTDNPSKFTLAASNIPSGATFSNNTLSWIPDQSNVGNTYTVKFIVSAVVGDKSYYRYQDLIMTVEQGPISNTQPNALFIVNPTTGTTSTIFNFDASGCTDNEDPTTALQVRWDWENDGIWDTEYSTSKTATHQYSTTGTKTVKLEVKDTGGLTDNITNQVYVFSSGTGEFQVDEKTVALWHLNEGSGTSFRDASNNHNNGIISGASWTSDGKFGNALRLDGENDFLRVPNAVSFSNINNNKELTVEIWIKVNSYPPSNKEAILLDKWGPSGDSDDEWGIVLRTDGKVRTIVNSSTSSGSPNTELLSSIPISLNSWVMITFLWNGNNQTSSLYFDETRVAHSNSAVSTMPHTNWEVGMGGSSVYRTAAPFNGLIDEIRISYIVRK